jgi:hypothetical protein
MNTKFLLASVKTSNIFSYSRFLMSIKGIVFLDFAFFIQNYYGVAFLNPAYDALTSERIFYLLICVHP